MRSSSFKKVDITSPDIISEYIGNYDPEDEAIGRISLGDTVRTLKDELNPAMSRAIGYELLGVSQKQAAIIEDTPRPTINSRTRRAKQAARAVLESS
jgi:DNA-directed RNA polymerase specialized sigma24 family protein